MCCRAANGFIRDLRIATIVISVLSLLENAGVLVYTLWAMKKTELFLLDFVNKFESGESHLLLLSLYVVAMIILAGILLLSIIAILLDVMLFFGALKRHRGVVKSWLRGHAVVSGAYLLYIWQILVALFAFDKMLLIYTLQGAAVLGAATVYFWVVVRRYDLKLKQPRVSTVSGNCGPPNTSIYVAAPSQDSAPCDPDKSLPGTHDSPPSYDLMMHQIYLSTVSGSCAPSSSNSHVPASSRRSDPCDSGTPVSDTPPPPYTSNP